MPLVRRNISVRKPVTELYEKLPPGPNVLVRLCLFVASPSSVCPAVSISCAVCRFSPVQNGVAVSNMLGLLQQLAELSEYATEVFNGLLVTAGETGDRVGALSTRLETMEQALPEFETALLQVPARTVYSQGRAIEFRRPDSLPASLLRPETAPEPLARRRLAATAPPQLQLMDDLKLVAVVALKDAAASRAPPTALECLKGYSHPGFFFEQWLLMEEERARKKAEERRLLKAKKTKKSKKGKDGKADAGAGAGGSQRKEVELVQFKRYNADGAEFQAEAEAKKRQAVASSFTVVEAAPMTAALPVASRPRVSSVTGEQFSGGSFSAPQRPPPPPAQQQQQPQQQHYQPSMPTIAETYAPVASVGAAAPPPPPPPMTASGPPPPPRTAGPPAPPTGMAGPPVSAFGPPPPSMQGSVFSVCPLSIVFVELRDSLPQARWSEWIVYYQWDCI
jgi:hypothetical protein